MPTVLHNEFTPPHHAVFCPEPLSLLFSGLTDFSGCVGSKRQAREKIRHIRVFAEIYRLRLSTRRTDSYFIMSPNTHLNLSYNPWGPNSNLPEAGQIKERQIPAIVPKAEPRCFNKVPRIDLIPLTLQKYQPVSLSRRLMSGKIRGTCSCKNLPWGLPFGLCLKEVWWSL